MNARNARNSIRAEHDRGAAWYAYLNQNVTWIPRRPRSPLPIVDMSPRWRRNAAEWLVRRARSVGWCYHMANVVSTFSHDGPTEGTVAHDAVDAFLNDEFEFITHHPEDWMRTTPLYRALVLETSSRVDPLDAIELGDQVAWLLKGGVT